MTKKTFKDGIYSITNEEYHAASGFSRSQLLLLDKSPYHFWYNVISDRSEIKKPTDAMIIGNAFHTLLLEAEKFSDEYAILPKLNKRTSEGKELFALFNEENSHKIILTIEQYEKVFEMVEHVKRHELVQTLLEDAVFEKSLFWTDEETGIQFKSRPDVWSQKMVVDVKTTRDPSLYAFSRAALNNGYYLQAGMAFEACKALGKPFEIFVILACEKEAPYAPAIFTMSDDAIQFGIDQFSSFKNKLKECLDSNQWPGYLVQELGVEKFALKHLENQDDE